MGEGRGIRPIYISGLFALVLALAGVANLYVSSVFYTARAGERLEVRVDVAEKNMNQIQKGLEENTAEQKKTQGVIQRLIIRMEREDARREALEEKARRPLHFPREGPP